MNTQDMSRWHVGYFDSAGNFWSLAEFNSKEYAEGKLKQVMVWGDQKYLIMEKQITWIKHD
ncbi:MAG: hypothetical protein RL078_576 [Bacteroidota bacterium]|jgi:hypothetical protein